MYNPMEFDWHVEFNQPETQLPQIGGKVAFISVFILSLLFLAPFLLPGTNNQATAISDLSLNNSGKNSLSVVPETTENELFFIERLGD